MPALGLQFLPGAIADFTAERPGIAVSLRVRSSHAVVQHLSSQQFDVGFSALDFDLPAIRRYAAASLALHLLWEVMQLPLYTIWSESIENQAFAVLHCTLGDLMIAGLTLLATLAIAGRPTWPALSSIRIWLLLITLGMAYTVYSEWLNVNVRGSWSYAPAMPRLPIVGTGLSPLLQWLVLPTLALRMALGRSPWRAS